MEPLATVASLERHLLKMVAKQWYDFDRSTFAFLKRLKAKGTTVTMKREHDFDENGLIHWLGTNARWVQVVSLGRTGLMGKILQGQGGCDVVSSLLGLL